MVPLDRGDPQNDFDLASILGQFEGRHEAGRRVDRVRQVVVNGGQAQIVGPEMRGGCDGWLVQEYLEDFNMTFYHRLQDYLYNLFMTLFQRLSMDTLDPVWVKKQFREFDLLS